MQHVRFEDHQENNQHVKSKERSNLNNDDQETEDETKEQNEDVLQKKAIKSHKKKTLNKDSIVQAGVGLVGLGVFGLMGYLTWHEYKTKEEYINPPLGHDLKLDECGHLLSPPEWFVQEINYLFNRTFGINNIYEHVRFYLNYFDTYNTLSGFCFPKNLKNDDATLYFFVIPKPHPQDEVMYFSYAHLIKFKEIPFTSSAFDLKAKFNEKNASNLDDILKKLKDVAKKKIRPVMVKPKDVFEELEQLEPFTGSKVFYQLIGFLTEHLSASKCIAGFYGKDRVERCKKILKNSPEALLDYQSMFDLLEGILNDQVDIHCTRL